MTPLDQIAPAFRDMAHTIVWSTVATVGADGRPRTRVLHPIWEWVGGSRRADQRRGRVDAVVGDVRSAP